MMLKKIKAIEFTSLFQKFKFILMGEHHPSSARENVHARSHNTTPWGTVTKILCEQKKK